MICDCEVIKLNEECRRPGMVEAMKRSILGDLNESVTKSVGLLKVFFLNRKLTLSHSNYCKNVPFRCRLFAFSVELKSASINTWKKNN